MIIESILVTTILLLINTPVSPFLNYFFFMHLLPYVPLCFLLTVLILFPFTAMKVRPFRLFMTLFPLLGPISDWHMINNEYLLNK